MHRLDDLLAESRPHVAPSAALDAVTTRVTTPRRRRGVILASLVTLSLAGGTAAVAGTGPLDDVIDYYLNGRHNDHAWEMDITGTDGTLHCIGGIVVVDQYGPDYVEADYLAIKKWVQEHDWSDLQPDPSLLRAGQRGTAEELAVTADRHMMIEAQEAGFDLTSVSTGGTATCWPR